MAGLRRFQSDLHGFAVAHFADQDHLGSLTQAGAQPVGERLEVEALFALVDASHLVGMPELHRVLECQDVDGPGGVDGVDQRRERRRLARTRCAREQDQAVFQLRYLMQDRGHLELGQGRDPGWQHTQNDAEVGLDAEDVDAKAQPVLELVAAVAVTGLSERGPQIFVISDQSRRDLLRSFGSEQRVARIWHGRDQLAVRLNERRQADREMKIRDVGREPDHRVQSGVYVECGHGFIGPRPAWSGGGRPWVGP